MPPGSRHHRTWRRPSRCPTASTSRPRRRPPSSRPSRATTPPSRPGPPSPTRSRSWACGRRHPKRISPRSRDLFAARRSRELERCRGGGGHRLGQRGGRGSRPARQHHRPDPGGPPARSRCSSPGSAAFAGAGAGSRHDGSGGTRTLHSPPPSIRRRQPWSATKDARERIRTDGPLADATVARDPVWRFGRRLLRARRDHPRQGGSGSARHDGGLQPPGRRVVRHRRGAQPPRPRAGDGRSRRSADRGAQGWRHDRAQGDRPPDPRALPPVRAVRDGVPRDARPVDRLGHGGARLRRGGGTAIR